MDCDQCGRYRPTARILPMTGPAGTIWMACDPCRRRLAPAAGRPVPVRVPIAPRALPVDP